LALRVGPRGLLTAVAAARPGCGSRCGRAGRLFQGLENATAMNNQLRTGADKGLVSWSMKSAANCDTSCELQIP